MAERPVGSEFNNDESKRETCEVVPISAISEIVDKIPFSYEKIILVGDRLSVCDEGVVLKVNGEVVSFATISPRGEMNDGQPTIVALYTFPRHRRKGYGLRTLQNTIVRCLDRGFETIRVNVIEPNVVPMINSLPPEMKSRLNINNSF